MKPIKIFQMAPSRKRKKRKRNMKKKRKLFKNKIEQRYKNLILTWKHAQWVNQLVKKSSLKCPINLKASKLRYCNKCMLLKINAIESIWIAHTELDS